MKSTLMITFVFLLGALSGPGCTKKSKSSISQSGDIVAGQDVSSTGDLTDGSDGTTSRSDTVSGSEDGGISDTGITDIRTCTGDNCVDCKKSAESCTKSSECCEGSCIDNICVKQNASCGEPGDSCELAADCCNSNCTGGKCGTTGGCSQISQDCTENSECCSNSCGSDLKCESVGAKCAPRGEACTDNVGCCSEFCDSTTKKCAGSSFCRSNLEVCSKSDDCCSHDCRESDEVTQCKPGSNTCRCYKSKTPFACAPVGEACNKDVCCSVACIDDGSGFKSCQFLGGCRPAGEVCRNDAECCNNNAPRRQNAGLKGDSCSKGNQCWSNSCVEGKCSGMCDFSRTGTPGIGRCLNPTQGAPAGEICQEPHKHTCVAGDDACVASAFGIKRCLGGGTLDTGTDPVDPNPNPNDPPAPDEPSTTKCANSGESCADDKACCCRKPDGSLCAGVCSNSTCGCEPDGATCSQGSECCNGVCRLDSVSGRLTCAGCSKETESCSASADCCGGFCDPATLKCGPPASCKPLGAICTPENNDCCSGMKCSGTCVPKETL